jgi:hypothetical protein
MTGSWILPRHVKTASTAEIFAPRLEFRKENVEGESFDALAVSM